jgi:hypothetical protein
VEINLECCEDSSLLGCGAIFGSPWRLRGLWCCCLLGLLMLEDEGATILWKVKNHSPNHTASNAWSWILNHTTVRTSDLTKSYHIWISRHTVLSIVTPHM